MRKLMYYLWEGGREGGRNQGRLMKEKCRRWREEGTKEERESLEAEGGTKDNLYHMSIHHSSVAVFDICWQLEHRKQ